MIDNPLVKLSDSNEITVEKILNNLLDGKKNLELKTHIAKPKKLASLLVLSNHLKKLGYNESSKTIKLFIRTFLEYMVSYNRLSRTETISALKPINMKDYIDKKFSTQIE